MNSLFGNSSCNKCGEPIISQINNVVLSGEGKVIDSLKMSDYDSVYWKATIVNPSTNERFTVFIIGLHQGGTTPNFTMLNRVGAYNNFEYSFNVDLHLGSLRLKFNNNSLDDYIIKLVRIPTEVFLP